MSVEPFEVGTRTLADGNRILQTEKSGRRVVTNDARIPLFLLVRGTFYFRQG